jgi:hypothetical protein
VRGAVKRFVYRIPGEYTPLFIAYRGYFFNKARFYLSSPLVFASILTLNISFVNKKLNKD